MAALLTRLFVQWKVLVELGYTHDPLLRFPCLDVVGRLPQQVLHVVADASSQKLSDGLFLSPQPEERARGLPALQDERLLSLLDDYHAFEDFPAMRQVMKEFASRGYLRDLYCRSQKDGIAECQLYADYVKKSLAQTRHFRAEFADYAVDSVFFALGLTDSVSEPSDHGFDPAAEYADW